MEFRRISIAALIAFYGGYCTKKARNLNNSARFRAYGCGKRDLNPHVRTYT